MPHAFSPSAGSTIAVQINASYVVIPGCEGVPEAGPEKGTYEVTAIDDTAKIFGEDLPDPGEMTLTGTWDSTGQAQAFLQTAASTTGFGAVSFKTTWAKKAGATTAATDTFNALILSFRKAGNKGKQQMFTSKVKLTGPVASVPAS